MSDETRTTYRFIDTDGKSVTFELEFDPDTYRLQVAPRTKLPIWTRLDFSKCPNCPLSSAQVPTCPTAEALVPFVDACGGRVSHDTVTVEVTARGRTTTKTTSIQRAYGSLLGLLVATSGCPNTDLLRPMARFHLPLADEIETLYRAVSSFLVRQYFQRVDGQEADLDLAGLAAAYAGIQKVNIAMARRLRLVSEEDGATNAVVLLDMYARSVPLDVKERLERLRPIFA